MIQGQKDANPSLSEEARTAAINSVVRQLETAGELEPGCKDPFIATDLAVRAHARALFKDELVNGHHVTGRPHAKDKRCVCLCCGKSLVVNSSKLALHIAAECVDDHPQLEEMVNRALRMKADAHFGKEKMQLITERAEAFKAAAPTGAASSSRKRSAPDGGSTDCGIAQHMDRELTDAEVAAIDQLLARWTYAEGISFNTLLSPHLHAALGKIKSSWSTKTKLSDWNLRHRFLYERVEDDVTAAISTAFALKLVS